MPASELTYFLAPLAGYTDLAYRTPCRRCGCQYAYTALIDSGALVHGNKENEHILQRGEKEPWLGVQLLGSIPKDIEQSARLLNDMAYDAVDFNMGCPMQKILKRNAGAALLKPSNHALAFQCVSLIRQIVTHKPFTVKLRVLDSTDPAPTIAFCKRLEDLGVEAITVHGRTADKIYSGPVACDVIRALRESLSIPVTANGGIFSLEDALALAKATGCNRLMVARGSLGNPWLFRDLTTGIPSPPSHDELCDTLLQHVLDMIAIYGETAACLIARKIVVAYLKGRGYRKQFRIWAGEISNHLELLRFVDALRAEGPVGWSSTLQVNE